MNTDVSPHETTVPWVDGLSVDAVLQATAERFPDRDAVVFPAAGLRWSWANSTTVWTRWLRH